MLALYDANLRLITAAVDVIAQGCWFNWCQMCIRSASFAWIAHGAGFLSIAAVLSASILQHQDVDRYWLYVLPVRWLGLVHFRIIFSDYGACCQASVGVGIGIQEHRFFNAATAVSCVGGQANGYQRTKLFPMKVNSDWSLLVWLIRCIHLFADKVWWSASRQWRQRRWKCWR